jgi:GNAT superfamily N-acetyltransferase
MALRFVTIAEQPELVDRLGPLIDSIWPEFMKQDPVANEHWPRLFTDFPQHQFVLLDGSELVGTANSIPIAWDGESYDLPAEGWDWALAKAMADADAGDKPAALVCLQIAIASSHQGQGLSHQLVRRLRDFTTQQGLKRLIIPVRPTHKHRYPLTPIERYIRWQRDDLPFDPWLRVHVRAGGQIIKPCPRAMTIRGTVAEWEGWTGMVFPDTGQYIIPLALAPLAVYRETDIAAYVEPNIWVEHQCAG